MSNRIEELLKQYCPDGVEYKKLGEIATISRGGSFQKKDFTESGIPCIHYGQIYTKYGLFVDETISFIDPVNSKKQKFAVKNDIVMAVTSENIEDVCKCIAYFGDEPAAISGHTAIIHHNQDAKYLVYYLHSSMFFAQKEKLAHGTKVIEVTPDKLNEVEVPVPPMEVQREIVRVLDHFTLLRQELSEKLSAELSARRKQYEYYRDELLTFDTEIPKKRIGDITRVFSASRVHREDWREEGVPFYRSSDVISMFNDVENSRGKAYISKELYETLSAKSGKTHKGDILVTGGGTIGIPYIIPDDSPLYFKDADLICIQRNDEIRSEFLYHYFLTTKHRDFLHNLAHDATIAHYTINQVENTIVPVPSIDIQDKIADVLDNFEAICNDLNIGLPTEINARTKQYEFYRDQLLTFAETGKTILTDRPTDRPGTI